jgi:RNA polymerase sigma-70 factor, ECF subfamily
MTQTDEMLMLQVRDGDVEKLGILFERHHRALLNFLSRTMVNRAAAEDLAQDVFCGILKFSGTFPDDSLFKP